MDVDQLNPEPITPAIEGVSRNRTRCPQSELTLSLSDAVVSFHITHSDSVPRTLARRLHALASIPSLPIALQEHANKVSSSSKHRELREIETNRYSVSVKRFARARQVAEEQEELYEKQLKVVEAELKREGLALKKEREMLAEQERIKESHGKVAAKLKELSSRPKQRVELDRYVFTISLIGWRFVWLIVI
jgi:DNA-directed RNA polymerase subunit K/omega